MTINHAELSKWFTAANAAKNFFNYQVADLVFSVVFEAILRGEELSVLLSYEDAGEEDTYLDLAGLSFEGMYLCIPVPKLKQIAYETFVARATFEDRREHNREYASKGDTAADYGNLIAELQALYLGTVLAVGDGDQHDLCPIARPCTSE